MLKELRRTGVLVAAGLALTACHIGGGGDDGGGAGTGTGTGGGTLAVKGTAVAGELNGSTITAYLVNADGTPGAAVGTATSAADGTFTLNVTLPSGTQPPVDLILSTGGGSYASEADVSKTVTNPASQGLSVLLTQVGTSGSSNVAITPLTSLVVSRAQGLAAGGAPSGCTGTVVSCVSATADTQIKAAFGISGSTTALNTLLPNFTVTTGDGASLALVVGALEEEAVTLAQKPADVVNALADDFADGVPDGKGTGGKAVTYRSTGAQIPGTLGSAQFLGGVSTYITASASPTSNTKSKGMTFDTTVVTAVKSGIANVAPSTAQLTTSSSGAISSLTDVVSGDQIVLVASGYYGLQGLDFKDPTKPVLQDYSALNKALAGLKNAAGGASLPTVDGVTGISGTSVNEAVVFSFGSPHVVLVDLSNQKVLSDADFSSTITDYTYYSGGSAYISSAISNVINGTVLLSTYDGFFAYDISKQTLGPAIPLSGTQYPAENLGGAVLGATFPAGGQLFSGNYGPSGYGGGLQIVNLANSTSYALDDTTFNTAFNSIGNIDGNSVDTTRSVGILSSEKGPIFGFVDLRDPAKFTFTGTGATATFSVTTPTVFTTADISDDYGYPLISGTAVEPVNGLVFGVAANSTYLMVAHVDDPAKPAGAAWAGFTDSRYYYGSYTEYASTGRDPHALGALLGTDGKSYGFTLSNFGSSESIIVVDLAAFLTAPADAQPASSTRPVHKLAATPFGTPIIQSIPVTNSYSAASAAARKAAVERSRAIHVRTH